MADIIGLEWDRHFVRAMEASASGDKVYCKRIAQADRREEGGIEELREIFGKMAKENGWRSPQVVFSLPRESFVVRRLEVPNVEEDELPDLVKLQAAAKSSQPIDEFAIDFIPLAKREGFEFREVLLGTIPRSTIDEIRSVVGAVNGQLIGVRISPVGTAEVAQRLLASGTQLVISKHDSRVEFAILEELNLVFSHAAQVTEGPIDQMIQYEVSRALVSLRRTNPSLQLNSVVLLGVDSEFRGVVENLEPRVGCPVKLFDPFTLVTLDIGAKAPEQENRSAYSGLVGTVLSHHGKRIPGLDFLAPRKPPVKTDHGKRRKILLGAGVALLVGVLYFSFQMQVSAKDREISKLRGIEQSLSKKQKQAAPEIVVADSVDTWLNGDPLWAKELPALVNRFPSRERMYLSEWRAEPKLGQTAAHIRVAGFAKERQDVIDFDKQMIAKNIRFRVNPHDTRPSTKDPDYKWEFEADLVFVPGDEPADSSNDNEETPAKPVAPDQKNKTAEASGAEQPTGAEKNSKKEKNTQDEAKVKKEETPKDQSKIPNPGEVAPDQDKKEEKGKSNSPSEGKKQ